MTSGYGLCLSSKAIHNAGGSSDVVASNVVVNPGIFEE